MSELPDPSIPELLAFYHDKPDDFRPSVSLKHLKAMVKENRALQADLALHGVVRLPASSSRTYEIDAMDYANAPITLTKFHSDPPQDRGEARK